MTYLLDSDVVIDFLRQKDPGFSLVDKVSGEKLYISVVTWIEILYGIKKANLYGKRFVHFTHFLEDLDIEIIPIDDKVGIQFVDLKVNLERKGERLADFDLLVASTAKIQKSTLVTRNIKHFDGIPNLKILKG